MWRAVTEVQRRGKPVVVSMGDVAGSGGYYVAAPADAIVAQSATITGSIGVVFTKFNLGGLLQRVGINIDYAKTAAISDALSITRPLTADELDQLNRVMGELYANFSAKVAQGRKLDAAQTEMVARGRIWSGSAAVANGLVDALGGMARAIELAREKAQLAPGEEHEIALYTSARGLMGLRRMLGSTVEPTFGLVRWRGSRGSPSNGCRRWRNCSQAPARCCSARGSERRARRRKKVSPHLAGQSLVGRASLPAAPYPPDQSRSPGSRLRTGRDACPRSMVDSLATPSARRVRRTDGPAAGAGNDVKPAPCASSRALASPIAAPSPAPPSASDVVMQYSVLAEYIIRPIGLILFSTLDDALTSAIM